MKALARMPAAEPTLGAEPEHPASFHAVSTTFWPASVTMHFGEHLVIASKALHVSVSVILAEHSVALAISSVEHEPCASPSVRDGAAPSSESGMGTARRVSPG